MNFLARRRFRMDYCELISSITSLINDNILPDCAFVGENKRPITDKDIVQFKDIVIEFDDSVFTDRSYNANISAQIKKVIEAGLGAKCEKTTGGKENLRVTIPVAYVFKGLKPAPKKATGTWCV